MLINVAVEKPDLPPLMGEVQIHLREIILAKEKMHKLYEIRRAPNGEKLLEEMSKVVVRAEPLKAQAAVNGVAPGGVNARGLRAVRTLVRWRRRAVSNRPAGRMPGGTVISPLQAGAEQEMVGRSGAEAEDVFGVKGERGSIQIAGENPLVVREDEAQSDHV